MTPVLEAREIIKDFPGVRALDQVSFTLHPGEIHALVGENGAGKSTLIKILAGVYPHGSFTGQIFVDSQPSYFASIRDSEAAGIAVIHQELLLVPYMTVAENIMLGDEPHRLGLLDREAMEHQACAALAMLEVDIDVHEQVVHLGIAKQQLVEIAKAIRKSSRILVLDEPTAALAGHEVERLLAILQDFRRKGSAIIYISHKLDEVLQIADRITVLRDGKTVATDKASNWTRQTLVRDMIGREMTEMFPKIEHHAERVVLKVGGLSVANPDRSGALLLDDVTFQVRAGEVVGLAGLMGAGRTELLSTLFGDAPGPVTGQIEINGQKAVFREPADAIRAGFAMIPEDRKRDGLALMFSVQKNLSMVHLDRFCKLGVVDGYEEHHHCATVADDMAIRTAGLAMPVETLSGGNQQKVVLGKWLLRLPRVLLLDEPTRGIDVGAKAEIHRLIGELTAKGIAVVMASSELPEVLAMADRILVMRRGRVTGQFTRAQATPQKVMELAT